jgi:16S rRNA (adenine1518-N6/adenine1519-N6)-dimethyltransferase
VASEAVAALPPLRDVIKAWQLDADKRLGQHFLLDLNLTAKIARVAGDLSGVTAIEIGPGPGGLTRALLDSAADRVVAIERDPRCVAALQSVVEAGQGRLTLIHGDALQIDPATLAPAPRVIVANLPYNVGTPLLIEWLKQASAYRSMTLMFQREVALRLAASPRSKDYGRLSVMAQWLTEVELVFDVPAAAFTPPPNVVSSIVRLTPRAMGPDEPNFAAMERVVAAAFAQRRKMLRAGLRSFTADPIALLESAGIDPTSRAEELDVDAFRRLTVMWERGRVAERSEAHRS